MDAIWQFVLTQVNRVNWTNLAVIVLYLHVLIYGCLLIVSQQNLFRRLLRGEWRAIRRTGIWIWQGLWLVVEQIFRTGGNMARRISGVPRRRRGRQNRNDD